jgi:hypothetical protein
MSRRERQSIAAATIAHPVERMTVLPETEETRAQLRAEAREHRIEALQKSGFRTVAEQVAESGFYYRGYSMGALKEKFSQTGYNPKLWTVSRYFPHAKGGPLYVVEPRSPSEAEEAAQKVKALRALGHRAVIIQASDTIDDVRQRMLEEGIQ